MTTFVVPGPAAIQFSGGRTSGLMLRRILDEGLRPDVHVLFQNTGKERAETLDFVHAVETRWRVPIVWLERDRNVEARWRVVTYETASRNGEPFAQLIAERKYLPNPITRYCTAELKIRTVARWMKARGYDDWTSAVGLRADEMHRVVRARNNRHDDNHVVVTPLADAGIVKADVEAFWRAQPFDLALQSWEGNCDLCFLKGTAKRERIMRDRPDLATWWIEREREHLTSSAQSAKFRKDTADYERIAWSAAQPRLDVFDDAACNVEIGDMQDCGCTE